MNNENKNQNQNEKKSMDNSLHEEYLENKRVYANTFELSSAELLCLENAIEYYEASQRYQDMQKEEKKAMEDAMHDEYLENKIKYTNPKEMSVIELMWLKVEIEEYEELLVNK